MNNGNSCNQSNEPWILRTSAGHEEVYLFRTVVLPGPPSPVEDRLEFEHRNTRTVISALISVPRLARFQELVSAISKPPPPIGESPLYVVKSSEEKGLGMFAGRLIQKGELIVWERPALILPGLERNNETSEDVYRLLTEGFLDVYRDLGFESDILLEAGRDRLDDVRRMAISTTFRGGHWLEGVVGTNALVSEFEDVKTNIKREKKDIYGGVYPLINRCNHSCSPNASVHFVPTLLTSFLCALRDIKEGEEITKSYVNPLLSRERRMKTLNENYGFECDCRSCTLSPSDSASSDERRSELGRLLSSPTFTRWSGDLTRSDDFLFHNHCSALQIVEEEEVWAVESTFLEEMALGYASLADGDRFRTWSRKVVEGGRWLGQVGEFPEGGEFKESESWKKWVWWLEDPERRVKKWGRRKKLRDEMDRRTNGVDLESGMLDAIFGTEDY